MTPDKVGEMGEREREIFFFSLLSSTSFLHLSFSQNTARDEKEEEEGREDCPPLFFSIFSPLSFIHYNFSFQFLYILLNSLYSLSSQPLRTLSGFLICLPFLPPTPSNPSSPLPSLPSSLSNLPPSPYNPRRNADS